MDSNEFRKAAHAAVDEICDYYETIEDRRVVSNVEPGYLRKIISQSPPEEGERWEDIQKDIESKIMPGMTHWQSPNFMAFFSSGCSFPSMIGELYSAALSAPAFNWICSPVITELETIVLDWMAQAFRLPECFLSKGEGGGVLQGSASEAIVTVMVAARERYLNDACKNLQGQARERIMSDVRGRMVALGSSESHSSTAKAAIIAGVRYQSIPCRMQDDLALTGQALEDALNECEVAGLKPFYLTTTLGTTATCAVDRFDEIKTVARQYPLLWIHVDAAWAGSALILKEYQHLAQHFDAFESFNMNMHKWMLVNFDASLLYVRRRTLLTSALSITPSYLRNSFSETGLVTDYRDWQIPLGRRFRSLKIWFVLRTYGIKRIQEYIRNHIELGEKFHSWVVERDDLFRVLTPPRFALNVLTIVSRGYESEARLLDGKAEPKMNGGVIAEKVIPNRQSSEQERANTITQEVYERINAKGEIYLTSSIVEGVYAIRVVSANLQTDEEHLRKAFEILVKTAEEVLNLKSQV